MWKLLTGRHWDPLRRLLWTYVHNRWWRLWFLREKLRAVINQTPNDHTNKQDTSVCTSLSVPSWCSHWHRAGITHGPAGLRYSPSSHTQPSADPRLVQSSASGRYMSRQPLSHTRSDPGTAQCQRSPSGHAAWGLQGYDVCFKRHSNEIRSVRITDRIQDPCRFGICARVPHIPVLRTDAPSEASGWRTDVQIRTTLNMNSTQTNCSIHSPLTHKHTTCMMSRM